MWGEDKEARAKIAELEQRLNTLGDTGHQVRRLDSDIESLTKRVRDLAAGGVVSTLIREALDKVDKEALIKEVTEALRADVAAKAGEAMRAALQDQDFVGSQIDEDRVEELLVEALTAHFVKALELSELTVKVAEELVHGEHLDLGEIEQGVVNDVTERMEVTVKLTGKEDD